MTAVVTTGALLGFLRYNFYPATIFMGDSGSLLLGYLAAVFPLVAPLDGHAVVNVLVPVVVLGLPLLDTMTSIARRIVNRQSIFVPDKDHIHHRLLRRFPEPDAVGGMYLASAWFGLAAVLMVVVPPFWAYLTFGTTAVVSVAWVIRLPTCPYRPRRCCRRIGWNRLPCNRSILQHRRLAPVRRLTRRSKASTPCRRPKCLRPE
jgi:UDP-GlcNAc:undecaprenyl-phosphate GlcNAc-1-phosphate transferase